MLSIIKINTNHTFSTDQIDGSLESMQAIVGGDIQPVDFELAGADATLWLNENGKVVELAPNAVASLLVGHRLFAGDYIAGNVFVTGGVDEEGATLGLNNAQIDQLIDRLASELVRAAIALTS